MRALKGRLIGRLSGFAAILVSFNQDLFLLPSAEGKYRIAISL